jgi:hypothetical protein
MNIQKKQEMQGKFDHTNFACMRSLSRSRVVFDFQVTTKKDFDEGCGKILPADVFTTIEVRKTHKYVGILSLSDEYGVMKHFAVSHNDPIFAAALVLKHTLARYEGTTMHAKLMRIHQKFFKVILEPKA